MGACKDYEVNSRRDREINVGDNIFQCLQSYVDRLFAAAYNGIIEGGYPVTPTQSGNVYTVDLQRLHNDVWLTS